MTPQTLLAAIDADAPLAQRHLWLMAVLDWVRGDRSDALACTRRVTQLLDAAEQRPEWLPRWQRWWSTFHHTVDVTPLLADHGFAPRTAFLSELGHRLRRKLLPTTPETTDIGPLFDLLFPYPFDVTWLRALDDDTLARIGRLLSQSPGTPESGVALSTWQQSLLDATVFAVSQVSATGFAAEIRVRMSDDARQARHFHALPQVLEAFRASVSQLGPHSPQAQDAANALRQQLDNCRHAAYTVYGHLEAHDISVGIVFRLRQLRERVLRTKGLIDCLLAEQGERASATLLADPKTTTMIMGNHGVLIIGATVADTFNRLTYFERAAETYIRALQTGRPLRVLSDDIAEKTAQEWEAYPGGADFHLREIKALLDEEGSTYAQ